MKAIMRCCLFILFIMAVFTVASPVSAQIVFPECRWNEVAVSCQCPHAYNVCADNTCSACLTYKNDPRYYFLWKDIYCRKGSVLELADKFKFSFIIPLLTTIVLETVVFALRGFRKTKELLTVALTNCLSIFIGIYLIAPQSLLTVILRRLGILSLFQNPTIHFSLYGMDLSRFITLLMAGALVTAVEALFYIYAAKLGDRKKVWTTAVIAHAVSLILGLGTLNAIYPHFLAPRLF